MSYFSLLSTMMKIKLDTAKAKDQQIFRNAGVPLNLSQDAAITISPVPMIVAKGEGALIGEVQERQTVSAVGKIPFMGNTIFRSYLSNTEGAFIESMENGTTSSFILYAHYMEDIPETDERWAFYLDAADGYIGYADFQSTNEDGAKLYHRSWSPGTTRIEPLSVHESIMVSSGAITRVDHRMMKYARRLGTDDKAPVEYLLVSAVETPQGASVNIWLGIELTKGDLTVFQS